MSQGIKSVAWAGVLIFAKILLTGCGEKATSDEPRIASYALQAPITLSAPRGTPVLKPVLEASNGLVLGARSQVTPSQPVVAMGTMGARAEPDARLNDLWSRGPVELRDRVHVFGSVFATSVTRGNGVIIDGSIVSSPVFDPPETMSWTVTFPTSTPINVDLFPPHARTLEPGHYGIIRMPTGSTLTLRAGVYYTADFQFEAGSSLRIDDTAGVVILYVSNFTAWRGVMSSVTGKPPDFFLGHLGTQLIVADTPFNGALVAPSATLALRAVAGGHTGFFAAKQIELDANAVVTYRFPLSVLPTANPTNCRALVPLRPDLTGAEQQAAYQQDLARYCGICISPHDSDGDGTVDCLDDCPYDPSKTLRGACGCGVSEVNADNDRVPACFDLCDNDPNNIFPGECGCVGQSNLRPAGTPCTDPACPGQTNTTCNATGVCGNRNACRPAIDCLPYLAQGSVYWICGGTGGTPRSWTSASQTCAARGMVLARVDTYAQNKFLRSLIASSFGTSRAWLGGNSRSVANAWRWARVGSDNGDQFWSGGATGTPVSGRFASWSLSRPGSARCLAMQPTDGRWIDNDCAQALPYVCEVPPTIKIDVPDRPPIPPPGPAPQTVCVPEDGGLAPLPNTLGELEDQYEAADAGVFTGAAANPPPQGSTCLPSGAAENCPLTNVQPGECTTDTDCASFGAGFVCRVTREDPNCVSDAGALCAVRAACGIPQCEVDPFANRCNLVEVCPGPGVVFDAGVDLGSALTPQTINPTQFFPGAPDTTPSPGYVDPPTGSGKDHAWCRLTPQETTKVQPAAQSGLSKQGQTGSGSPIRVSFNPDLIFDANPNPLAFGETNLSLHAAASLAAHVSVNGFLGQSYDGDVLRAAIGIRAERCRITTNETTLTVLGQDILDLAGFIPKIDTDDASAGSAHTAGQSCKSAMDGFLLKADRVKKAFRDAQQLLNQYHTVKNGGARFATDFCQQAGVLELVSKNFPMAGVCPEGEPPELTINRFIDYYQGDEMGELLNLRSATSALNVASAQLRNTIASALNAAIGGTQIQAPFVDFKRQESVTILNAPFFIGPVPMTLEIAAVSGYGVHGSFGLDLALPTDLGSSRGDLSNPAAPVPQDIAKVAAAVEPWASAGLSLFVGAGFSVPGVSASVGIEGAVTLARIGAPLAAGVGISLATTPDPRPLPEDITRVAQVLGGTPAFAFGPPAAYQFFLNYEYGASVNLTDVLSGTVSGRLRIKFFFFSRTWRKKVVQFNGWSQNFQLIAAQGNTRIIDIRNGSLTNSATGNAGMGRSEPELPFVFLTPLVPDVPLGNPDGDPDGGVDAGPPAPATGAVDKTAVQAFSYDELCCSKQGEQCSPSGRPSCCPELSCSNGICQPEQPPACADVAQTCGFNDALGVEITCCSGLPCQKNGICPPLCVGHNAACGADTSPCCVGLSCIASVCQSEPT